MKVITGASVILTEACNLSCSYCYEKRKTPEVMTEEMAFKAVDFLFDNSNNEKMLSFIWFGGEPLLNFPVLVKAVQHAKERAQKENKRLDQLVITNGTIWNDEIEQFFKDNSDVRIQISWDGHPDFQDAERGLSSDVETTLARMIKLTNHLCAHVQVTPTMVPRLLENVSYIASKMGSKMNVVLRHIPEVPGWTPEVLEKFREQLFLCYEKFEDKIEKLANCERALTSNGICGAGKNFGSFTPSGEIYACHRFYFNKNRDFKVGTVDEGFIHNAKTELLEEYTRDNIIGCTECDAYEFCDRCIASNFGENYDILMPTDDNCEVNKSVFFGTYNYIKTYRPWMTNYEPQPITKIATIPKEINNRSFITNYLLPMYYEQQEQINFLFDKMYKLESKVEYYERKKSKGSCSCNGELKC
jgi:uncharacterized protein